ncbi:hypothetical protein HN928_01170 [bacterium]|mgnify:FL=1|nr:hypothetical protein [bacterium]
MRKYQQIFFMFLAVFLVVFLSSCASQVVDQNDDSDGDDSEIIQISAPADNDTVSGTSKLYGTYTQEVTTLTLKVEDGAESNIGVSSGNWQYYLDTTEYDNGEYNILVNGYAEGDLLASGNILININNESEAETSLTISYPAASQEVFGIIEVSGNYTTNFDSIKINFNNHYFIEYTTTMSEGSWSKDFETDTLVDGTHKVVAIGSLDGDEYYSRVVSFVIDQPLLWLDITSDEDQGVVSGALTVIGTYIGSLDAIKTIVDADDEFSASFSQKNWSCDIDTTALSNGDHQLKAVAYLDAEQYESAAVDFTVNNDSDPFTLGILQPNENQEVSGTISISGTYSGGASLIKVIIDDDSEKEYAAAFSNGTWSLSFDTTTLANGVHEIAAEVYLGSDKMERGAINFEVNN